MREVSQKEKNKYLTLRHIYGIQKDGTDEIICKAAIKTQGEGNGNPLQYSCLENPMDRGAWWAAIHGVAQLDTTEATQQQQQQSRHRHKKQTFGHEGSGKEERVGYMEIVTWKVILPYVMYQPRGIGQGGRFRRDGIYIQLWLIHGEV